MARFVLVRLLWTIPVLVVVLTLVFFAMRSIGGDPLRYGPLWGLRGSGGWTKSGDFRPPGIETSMQREFKLDRPWYEQYVLYLQGAARLDMGTSFTYRNRTVRELVSEHAPRSLALAGLALLWAVAIGVPAGLAAALRAGGALDAVVRFLIALGVAVPSFLLATLLIYLFAVQLGWLPTSGWDDGWSNKVLPSFTLSLLPMAVCARLLRASTLEVLGQDYVMSARARGLRGHAVVGRHVLRNAAGPLVTAAGPVLGTLITGGFIVELIFDVPGIARFYVASVAARDYPVVLGLTTLLAAVIVVSNLVVDVVQALLDPRVREAQAGRTAQAATG
jgi:oligopeptide transport system permease protein